MKITVLVKTFARKESLELLKTGEYLVKVNEKPVENKANKRVIEMLADHFGCSKSSISLVAGAKSKKKIFEII